VCIYYCAPTQLLIDQYIYLSIYSFINPPSFNQLHHPPPLLSHLHHHLHQPLSPPHHHHYIIIIIITAAVSASTSVRLPSRRASIPEWVPSLRVLHLLSMSCTRWPEARIPPWPEVRIPRGQYVPSDPHLPHHLFSLQVRTVDVQVIHSCNDSWLGASVKWCSAEVCTQSTYICTANLFFAIGASWLEMTLKSDYCIPLTLNCTYCSDSFRYDREHHVLIHASTLDFRWVRTDGMYALFCGMDCDDATIALFWS